MLPSQYYTHYCYLSSSDTSFGHLTTEFVLLWLTSLHTDLQQPTRCEDGASGHRLACSCYFLLSFLSGTPGPPLPLQSSIISSVPSSAPASSQQSQTLLKPPACLPLGPVLQLFLCELQLWALLLMQNFSACPASLLGIGSSLQGLIPAALLPQFWFLILILFSFIKLVNCEICIWILVSLASAMSHVSAIVD